MRAFWELCSERQFGQSMGPIPWSSIAIYADRCQLDDDMRAVFEYVIRDMDECYIRYQIDEQETRAKERK